MHRNEFIIYEMSWHTRERPIVDYFNERRIYNPRNMSSIILTSFQAHLRGEEIELDQLIEKHIELTMEKWDCHSGEDPVLRACDAPIPLGKIRQPFGRCENLPQPM